MNLTAALSDINLPIGALTLTTALRTLLILVIGLAVIRILLNFLNRMLKKSHTLATFSGAIRGTVKALLYILLVLILLGSLGIEVTSLIALLSVAGLSVSLALQSTLSNLAGGLMILITKPFQVGDYISVGNIEGTVSAIGLSYSTIVTVDNKEIFYPNSQLSGEKITNYNHLGKRRIDLTFTTSYDAPTATARKAIEEAIAAYPQVLSEPAPAVYVTDYGSSAISYLMRAWVKSEDYWPVRYGITETVRETFAKNNVEMTYDHLNIHMIQSEKN